MADKIPASSCDLYEAELLGKCSICQQVLTAEETYQLVACGHLYHRLCLRKMIRVEFRTTPRKRVDVRRRRLVDLSCPNCRCALGHQDTANLQMQNKILNFRHVVSNVIPDAQYRVELRCRGRRQRIITQEPILGRDLQPLEGTTTDEKLFSTEIPITVDNGHSTFQVKLERLGPGDLCLITQKTVNQTQLVSVEKDASDEERQQPDIEACFRRQQQQARRTRDRSFPWDGLPDTPSRQNEVFDLYSASSLSGRSSPDLPPPSEIFSHSSAAGESAVSTAHTSIPSARSPAETLGSLPASPVVSRVENTLSFTVDDPTVTVAEGRSPAYSPVFTATSRNYSPPPPSRNYSPPPPSRNYSPPPLSRNYSPPPLSRNYSPPLLSPTYTSCTSTSSCSEEDVPPRVTATPVTSVTREPRPGPSREDDRSSYWTDGNTRPRNDESGRGGREKRKKCIEREKILKRQMRLRKKFKTLDYKIRSNVRSVNRDLDNLFNNISDWKKVDEELCGTDAKTKKCAKNIQLHKKNLYASIKCLSKCLNQNSEEGESD